MEKIKRSELVYAKNYIDGHTPYTVEKQQYDSWVFILLNISLKYKINKILLILQI